MNDFKNYLQNLGYQTNTIKGILNNLNYFFEWCRYNAINPKKANLNQLYEYQDYNRKKGNSVPYMRDKNKTLIHYFQFIKRKENPALLLKTEKRETKLPSNILDEEYLLNIYISIKANTVIEKRNKVVMGLAIYQGLKRSDLELIQLENVDLKNNRIFIPSTKSSNSRYIPLKSYQLQDLQYYIYDLRPQLLINAKKQTNKLFFSMGLGEKLNNVLTRMLKILKSDFSYITSLAQFQQSRITLWLKEFGLRQTQYLSGFKYVTSVERYVTNNNDSLREKIKLIHPLDRLGI